MNDEFLSHLFSHLFAQKNKLPRISQEATSKIGSPLLLKALTH
jgi:hypothetical protein